MSKLTLLQKGSKRSVIHLEDSFRNINKILLMDNDYIEFLKSKGSVIHELHS